MTDDGWVKAKTTDGFRKVTVHRGDDKVRRDHLGRYLLPDPETGRDRPWTRVTTIAGELKDRYGLEKWDQRNIVYGTGQRKSLWARAAAARLTDVKELDDIAKEAKAAADSHAGADMGSALHTFSQRVDQGEEVNIPEPFGRDIRAYQKGLELAGIATWEDWIERIVIIPELGCVGTLDRVNNAMEWPLPRIGDLKTATDKVSPEGKVTDPITRYGMQDIPLQLALYSRGTHWWDFETETWQPMPPVDQFKAMVFHVPAEMGECRIYEVDIEAGWQAVQYAMWEREWRRRKDLCELVFAINSSGEIAREAQPKGGDGSTSTAGNGKGAAADNGRARAPAAGEAVTPTAEDPPASPPPPSGHRGPIADAPVKASERMAQISAVVEAAKEMYGGEIPDFLTGVAEITDPLAPANPVRWAWAKGRVDDIKAHEDPTARKRLAGLWSPFDVIPLFPNAANPDRSGPRNWAELSKIVALCDLVEMEFAMPFGDSDPNPDVTIPSPAERRKEREQKYQDEQTARHKASAKKAAATRARNKAAKETTT